MIGRGSSRWTLGRICAAAFAAATGLGLLFVFQDLVFSGIEEADVDLGQVLVQDMLPWYGWAALTPLLLLLLRGAPIEGGRGVLVHLLAGPAIAVAKLLLTAPAAAALIWSPAGVAYGDGLRWLLIHRTAPNMVMYWLLVAAYTAIVFARARGQEGLDAEPVKGGKAGPIPLHVAGRILLVEAGDIDHVEAEGNYLHVHVGSSVHRIRSTLTAFASILPAGSFLRIHRSRLVNVRRIREVHPWFHGDYAVVLLDGTQLVTGRTYRTGVRRLLHRVPA